MRKKAQEMQAQLSLMTGPPPDLHIFFLSRSSQLLDTGAFTCFYLS